MNPIFGQASNHDSATGEARLRILLNWPWPILRKGGTSRLRQISTRDLTKAVLPLPNGAAPQPNAPDASAVYHPLYACQRPFVHRLDLMIDLDFLAAKSKLYHYRQGNAVRPVVRAGEIRPGVLPGAAAPGLGDRSAPAGPGGWWTSASRRCRTTSARSWTATSANSGCATSGGMKTSSNCCSGNRAIRRTARGSPRSATWKGCTGWKTGCGKNHPDVMMESCASGGNRIDLATIQRRHTYLDQRPDHGPAHRAVPPGGPQPLHPGSGQGVAFTPKPEIYRKFDAAAACAPRTWAAKAASPAPSAWPAAYRSGRRNCANWSRSTPRSTGAGPYLAGNFYLLADQPKKPDSWSGWQFHDAKTGEGFVQAFRSNSREKSKKFILHDLDPARTYELSDPYTQRTLKLSGKVLTTEGLELDLPPMSSLVWIYRRG